MFTVKIFRQESNLKDSKKVRNYKEIGCDCDSVGVLTYSLQNSAKAVVLRGFNSSLLEAKAS